MFLHPLLQRLMSICLLALGAMSLSSCSTIDHHEAFDAYEADYRNRVEYKTHMVDQDGLKIHVREYGWNKAGPALVMMHGFPDSMHLYDWLVPKLANERHIITFDFIGWGDSDKPRDHRYDVASLRANLEAVIAYFGLQNVVLVVHDASGQPGIDWALDNADMTAGLVLLNTYYGPMKSLKAPEAIARFSTPGLYRDISVWLTTHFDRLWIKGYNEQIEKFVSNQQLRAPVTTILGHQSLKIRPAFFGLNRVLREEVEKRAGRMTDIRAFDRPVTIIFGADDPYLNAGVAREFFRQFSNAESHLIKGAGHFVQIDKPEEVAALLRDFPVGR